MPQLSNLPASITLADDLFTSLRDSIVAGILAPGSKLNEPQLSKQFGVSRGPLREAIRRLEGCKLVELRPNSGARVITMDLGRAIEVYEIRESLEGLACHLTALRRTDEDCARLRELLAASERQISTTNPANYDQHEGDLDFHFLIVKMSGNHHLFTLLCEELYDLLRMYRSQSSSSPLRPVQAHKEHHQIVDAIENRDAELAELLMRRHIRNARETLINKLADQPAKGPVI